MDPNAILWTPPPAHIKGTVDYYDLREDDNFSQPRVFWNKVLDEGEKSRMVENLANTIRLANDEIRNRAIGMFSKVDEDMGNRLGMALATKIKQINL